MQTNFGIFLHDQLILEILKNQFQLHLKESTNKKRIFALSLHDCHHIQYTDKEDASHYHIVN